MTDDTFMMDGLEGMTWRDFTNSFLVFDENKSVEQKLQEALSISDEIMNKLSWLGLFDDEYIGIEKGSPSQLLQKLLESKWSLDDGDKDMIVMQHQFEYLNDGETKKLLSSLVLEGREDTAMSMTVGLPVAIATELILKGEIKGKGVKIPVDPSIYVPVLDRLKDFGISFVEEEG